MSNCKNTQDILLAYRECARHVWNTWFRELPDGWHGYINVESELFEALVLDQLFPDKNCGHGYHDIRIVPTSQMDRIKVLWNDKSNEKEIRFQEITIIPSQIDLRFIDFFDWNENGYRDYQYIKCHIRQYDIDTKLNDTELLIEVGNAAITLATAK